MKIISSKWTWFYKRFIYFVLIFVALSGFIPILAAQGKPNAPPVFVVAVPLVIVGVAWALSRRMIVGLADEVEDGGAYLIVRRAGQEEQVFLTNIMNVSYSLMINPPRITLRLRQPGRFGNEIAFIPPRPGIANSFRLRNPLADELIERVDAARGK